MEKEQKTVLVLGGRGFIGRHVAQALIAQGFHVIVGTRYAKQPIRLNQAREQMALLRQVRLERCTKPAAFLPLLQGVDIVINCVGILRERWGESYEAVHHLAPAALAAACKQLGIRRLIHVSALGLHEGVRSGFLRSKLKGERAVANSGLDWSIVRPSLLDGEGGFGAKYCRALSRLPLHVVPKDAVGKFAALQVSDLGEAIAKLCVLEYSEKWQAVELGGMRLTTMAEHLSALRAEHSSHAALTFKLPALMARVASHLCDLLHVSPYSFGHWELLHHDNVPRYNALRELLGRAPLPVGVVANDGEQARLSPHLL